MSQVQILSPRPSPSFAAFPADTSLSKVVLPETGRNRLRCLPVRRALTLRKRAGTERETQRREHKARSSGCSAEKLDRGDAFIAPLELIDSRGELLWSVVGPREMQVDPSFLGVITHRRIG